MRQSPSAISQSRIFNIYRDAHNKLWTNYREVCVEADELERKVNMCGEMLTHMKVMAASMFDGDKRDIR